MKSRTEEYILQAEKYLEEGEEELKRKNIKQVSEKYWGACASILKAWAEERGVQHNGHTWLFKAADGLSEERRDPSFRKRFILASTLHTNFYEGWLTEREVEEGVQEAKRFCKEVKKVLKKEGGER